jgi:hypothetical protein
MALSLRFYPLPGRSVITASSGRTYAVTTGVPLSVPFPDALDVGADQAVALCWTGLTGDRPTLQTPGGIWPFPRLFYDTTLSEIIFSVPNSNPVTWIDINGNSV